MTTHGLKYHAETVHDAGSAIYGTTLLVQRLLSAKADGGIPQNVIDDLTGDFIPSSLAMAMHHAAAQLIDHIEVIENQLEKPNDPEKDQGPH